MLADWTGRPDTIDEVVATMRRLDLALPDSGGLKWFNYLYLTVTEAVLAEAATWQDRPFLQQFDVVFARLYFDAIVHWERDAHRTPHAWRPLLRTRHDVKRARIQFALAGMNAHINHDLPIALNTISVPDGRFPSREGARYNDFLRVNDVLARVEASVRPLLSRGLVGDIDLALGELDNILGMWKVDKARDAAWTNGEVLWHLRAAPLLQRDYLSTLDRMTAFAGRGLLLPVLMR